MQKEKKELLHIQVKDNGLLISEKIGNTLADTRATLERDILGNLISGADETSLTRYKIAQNLRLRAFKVETNKVINETKKSVKNALKKDTTVNLNNKQINKVSNEVNVGLNALGNNAVKTYQNTLNSVFLQVKAAKDLKEQLQKHINSGVNIGVVYKDGKNYKFDSYYEMKSRTDIQTYIGENMVSAGNAAGVIFYIAAYFGDCAKDHVDYQGKIYVDKDWEESAPADRVDEIRNYINQHNVKTVQEIMDAPYYFTTRPNCRHYFQYVDIDSVLGAKTNKEVSNLRDKMNLNFNGKYQPEKYEALQKQRLNERMIRAKKEEVTKYEQLLDLNPKDEALKIKILNGEASIRHYQANQRQLEKDYDNISRSYMREQPGGRVDFGVSNDFNKMNFVTPILKNSDNDKLIGRKHIGISNKSFDEVSKISQQMLNKRTDNDKMLIESKSDPRLYYENCLVRKYYHEKLSKLNDLIPKNASVEEQAKFAFTERNNIRLDARSKMVDEKALGLLPKNKDFEELVKSKMTRKGITRDEALKDIIRTSSISNTEFDKLFKEDD